MEEQEMQEIRKWTEMIWPDILGIGIDLKNHEDLGKWQIIY